MKVPGRRIRQAAILLSFAVASGFCLTARKGQMLEQSGLAQTARPGISGSKPESTKATSTQKPGTQIAGARAGQKAPDFTLIDSNGKTRSLSDYKGKFVILEWVNFECPFVGKHYDSGNMWRLQKKYRGLGAVWLSINSSAPGKQGNYPPEKINKLLLEKGSCATAYLLDPEGSTGRLYGATATPHMFVVNPQGTLIYTGAIDDRSTADRKDINGAKNYVELAMDAALAGKPVVVSQTQAYGCSVKYK